MQEVLLTTDAILNAFATADGVLPRAALTQARNRWPEVAPALLALLQAAADRGARSERSEAILFYAIYLVAQVRETRAHRALCAIAADGERASDLIGDGLTEDFGLILARTYDGDPAGLRSVIEAAGADEFARDAAFVALAWLTATGRIDRDDTAGYLRHLHTTLQPQGPCWIWVAWQRAIASLGL
ncbi:MAG TPA: DUF1186 domain-containing protein, partial [Rhodopila sp.]